MTLPELPNKTLYRGNMTRRIKGLFYLFLGHFANDIYPGMLPPLLPIFIAKFGWSFAKAGILITVMQICCNFSQLVFGIINDHKPMKSFLWIGIILSGLPFCFMMNIDSLTVMIIAIIISGLGVGLFHPVAAVAAGFTADEKRKGISMAFFSSGGSFGVMTAPLLIVLVIEVLGDSYMPIVIIPALIMASLLAYDKTIVMHKSHGLSLNEWFSTLFVNKREFFIIWLVSSLRAIIVVLITSFLPVLYMARDTSYALSNLFLSASLLAGMLGMYAGGYLSDVHGQRKVMALMLFISSPFFFIFLFTSGAISFLMLLLGMATISSTIPITIVFAQRINRQLSGIASSFVMGLSFGMGALAATPFGMLADYMGIENAMYVPCILPILSGITVLFLKKQ